MKNFAFKFRIYPNKEQIEYFDKCFRVNNYIYGYFLTEQIIVNNIFKYYLKDYKEISSLKKTLNKFFYNDDELIELSEIKSLLNTEYEKNKELIEYLYSFLKRKNVRLYFNNYKASTKITALGTSFHDDIKIVDSTIKDTTTLKLKNAFDKMVKEGAGFPKYKDDNNLSFSGSIKYNGKPIPQNFKVVKTKPNTDYCIIDIPKLDNLEVVIHRDELKSFTEFKLNPKEYTISKNPKGEYYISIMVDNLNEEKVAKKKKGDVETLISPKSLDNVLGIDLGVVRAITTSNINDFDNPIYSNNFKDISDIEKQIRVLNKVISTKMDRNKDWRNSNTCKRLRSKITGLHDKLKKKRDYYQHQITSELVNKTDITHFVIEDLKTKNMTIRAKNKNVKQKSGLNRSILNIGFYGIASKLEYKAKDNNKHVVKVNPRNTSITCSCCGHIDKENRKTQDKFLCVVCGHKDNADFNAGKNIRNIFIKNTELKLDIKK